MNAYKFDAVSRTLIISADFADALNDFNSVESKLYRKMLNAIPDLRVERKTHASPTSYKGKNGKRTSYYPSKGLSFERMEKFMRALPNGGQKYLDEYNSLRAACVVCLSPYAVARRWFEAQFPLYRSDPLFYVKNEVDVIDFSKYLEEAKKNA